MPTLPSSSIGPMSQLSWLSAASRVAGAVSNTSVPDTLAAAKDAIEETLQDWDTRRDWKYTQVVAPDIALDAGSTGFDLPTNFKKPYVAYLQNSKTGLYYMERANWHRAMPGFTDGQIARWYTLFNENETGRGDLFPKQAAADILVVLYYRSVIYRDDDNAFLDIPQRWEVRILDGAKARLTLGKNSQKAEAYFALYEAGLKKAKEDDQRLPDQFVSFAPPSEMVQPAWLNPNSTWQSTSGWEI